MKPITDDQLRDALQNPIIEMQHGARDLIHAMAKELIDTRSASAEKSTRIMLLQAEIAAMKDLFDADQAEEREVMGCTKEELVAMRARIRTLQLDNAALEATVQDSTFQWAAEHKKTIELLGQIATLESENAALRKALDTI